LRRAAALVAIVVPAFISAQRGSDTLGVSEQARQLHMRAIVIDTHDDTTQRLVSDKRFAIGARNTDGNIDIPRMRGMSMLPSVLRAPMSNRLSDTSRCVVSSCVSMTIARM